jgi:hypothetical protein
VNVPPEDSNEVGPCLDRRSLRLRTFVFFGPTLTFPGTIDADNGGFKDRVSQILAPCTDHGLSLVLDNCLE